MCWPLPIVSSQPDPAAGVRPVRPPPRAPRTSKRSTPKTALAAAAAAAAVPTDCSTANKATAAALRARLGQHPQASVAIPAAVTNHPAAPPPSAAASGTAAAPAPAAAGPAAQRKATNPLAQQSNLRRNPGRQPSPEGVYAASIGKNTHPNPITHNPNDHNPNIVNPKGHLPLPFKPSTHTHEQPANHFQPNLQAGQQPRSHFVTPPKRAIKPKHAPGRPLPPPVLNMAKGQQTQPQPGQQSDFEHSGGHHQGQRYSNYTTNPDSNFNAPQSGYGNNYFHADYPDFEPPGFHNPSQSSQYNHFSGNDAMPKSTAAAGMVGQHTNGNAGMGGYTAEPAAAVGQKRKFSRQSQDTLLRSARRAFMRGSKPPAALAKAPDYASSGGAHGPDAPGPYVAYGGSESSQVICC